jgi:hypothetical protein
MDKVDEQMLEELRRIRLALELLSSRERVAMKELFGKKVLKTTERATMFWAMDGAKDAETLAGLANVGARAAQKFIKEAEDDRWISVSSNGRCRIPSVNHEAVFEWYYSQMEG